MKMKTKILTLALISVTLLDVAVAASVTTVLQVGGNDLSGGLSGESVTYSGSVTNQRGEELSSGSTVSVGDTLYIHKDTYNDNTAIGYFCPTGPNAGSPYGQWSANPYSQSGDLFVKPPVTTTGAYGFVAPPQYSCQQDPDCYDPDPRNCQVCDWDYSQTAAGSVNCNGAGTVCTVTGAGNIAAYLTMGATDYRSNYSISSRNNSCDTNTNGSVPATSLVFNLYALPNAPTPTVNIHFSLMNKVKSMWQAALDVVMS